MRQSLTHFKCLTVLVLGLALCGLPCRAESASPSDTGRVGVDIDKMCPLVESAANANGLPVDFFVRLIWQESHFHADEVGRLTASGKRAEGIAQFMPATAAEHDLTEPFNPSEALPKSAAFLAQLRNEFGNLGLAAAAYNAGPQRLRDYLAGTRGIPAETRNYVFTVTGRRVEEWSRPAAAPPARTDSETAGAPVTCQNVVALLNRASAGHLVATDRQSGRTKLDVPSWCSGLRHPNVGKCGGVHLREPTMKSELRLTSVSHVHLSNNRVNLRGSRSH
jgi:hypothetical protein